MKTAPHHSELTKRGYEFAETLWKSELEPPEAIVVLAIAMGIYLESVEGSHREILPMAKALNRSAQIAFDAMRDGRNRGVFGA